MLKLRWGVIAGLAAFVLSLALGIVNGNNLFPVVMRAFVFMIVFFGLGLGSGFLITSFIPELLYADSSETSEGAAPVSGSRVNINLDNSKGYALPENYRNSDNPEEMGNIADLVSGAVNPAAAAPSGGTRGIDQNRENGYNYTEQGVSQTQGVPEFEDVPAYDDDSAFQGGQSAAAVFSPSFGNGDGLGGLPDLDAMAGAFLTNAGMDSGFMAEAPVAAPAPVPEMPDEPAQPERKTSGNKAQPMKGDFNPKELAEGIRTVLSKET